MSLRGLVDSPAVCRLWRNTQAANRNWDATQDLSRPTLDDLRAWHFTVAGARGWFERDVLSVEEFEGLVALAMERHG